MLERNLRKQCSYWVNDLLHTMLKCNYYVILSLVCYNLRHHAMPEVEYYIMESCISGLYCFAKHKLHANYT